jgi:uncharacterized protein YdhG (YjbR/CyaY superfamily)
MASRKPKKDPELEVREKIAEMSDADRRIAEPLHELIKAAAPELTPKLWYSQPAYARDGKVVVFFRGADVDKERYLTLGFSGNAQLDEGNIWPTAYAVTAITGAEEKLIADLVKRAAG